MSDGLDGRIGGMGKPGRNGVEKSSDGEEAGCDLRSGRCSRERGIVLLDGSISKGHRRAGGPSSTSEKGLGR